MLQIAICDDEVTNILKVKELAELFFRTHCVEIRIEIYKSSDNLLYDMQDGQSTLSKNHFYYVSFGICD